MYIGSAAADLDALSAANLDLMLGWFEVEIKITFLLGDQYMCLVFV